MAALCFVMLYLPIATLTSTFNAGKLDRHLGGLLAAAGTRRPGRTAGAGGGDPLAVVIASIRLGHFATTVATLAALATTRTKQRFRGQTAVYA
jgi:ABC-type spermidine/putrescine transport system permease subunit II